MKIEAAYRLLSFYPNDYDKQHYAKESKVFKAFNELKQNSEDLGTHNHIDIHYVQASMTKYGMQSKNFFIAYDGPNCVGYLVIRTLRPIPQVGIAGLLPTHIGQGIGYALYEAAKKRLKKLRSSFNLSVGSSKTWAKLVHAHNGVLIMGKEELKPIKFVTASDGMTYPVIKRGTKEVSLESLLNSGDSKIEKEARASYYQI
jgi:GNAT superfamily N-acetyltransferase